MIWPNEFSLYSCIVSMISRDTGKSLSEVLIFASTNPQHDTRLFIELQVQYRKIPCSNLGRTCCVQKLFLTFRTIFVHNMFSPCSAKRIASDKDLPVQPLFSLHKIPLSILVLCIKQLDINWWFTSNQNLYIDLVKNLPRIRVTTMQPFWLWTVRPNFSPSMGFGTVTRWTSSKYSCSWWLEMKIKNISIMWSNNLLQ